MTRYVFKSLAILAMILATTNAACADSPLDYTVSLGEAITKGLQANINILTAGTRMEEANGSRERRLSAYLPHVRIETPFAYQSRNLKAQGISFPNSPSIVGPFTSYDFRVYGDQTIFDLQSYHTIKASEKDQTARTNDYEEARSQVIRQVAVNYIVAEYAAAKVETAESLVRTSETLEKLARNQRDVGVADGIDVLRAQVQLANDRQNLLVVKNSYQKSLLVLARSIGVDLAARIRLSDRLVFKKLAAPQIEQAVQAAL
ncbi:MAG: TolC family protein, partial [Desulfuromonadaceae bacterium]|nr:TolC family protein [Desulfuromonadaceae bacterium]